MSHSFKTPQSPRPASEFIDQVYFDYDDAAQPFVDALKAKGPLDAEAQIALQRLAEFRVAAIARQSYHKEAAIIERAIAEAPQRERLLKLRRAVEAKRRRRLQENHDKARQRQAELRKKHRRAVEEEQRKRAERAEAMERQRIEKENAEREAALEHIRQLHCRRMKDLALKRQQEADMHRRAALQYERERAERVRVAQEAEKAARRERAERARVAQEREKAIRRERTDRERMAQQEEAARVRMAQEAARRAHAERERVAQEAEETARRARMAQEAEEIARRARMAQEAEEIARRARMEQERIAQEAARRAHAERERMAQEAEETARRARMEQEQRQRQTREVADQLSDPFDLYERKWAELKTSRELKNVVGFHEFPFPITDIRSDAAGIMPADFTPGDISYERVRDFLFHPSRRSIEGKTKREVLRAEALRWHPDKFDALICSKMRDGDWDKTKEAGGLVARWVTRLMKEA
ncbi:hypothetical protein TRAPUB_8320 [Trametes pubescens]|uniref:Uncharacterized protein n=1 Tax=Trametes pubescens TaxID=154538 RepID=A0A1M2W5N8_TRAPU|nr:hypothetical protein TRAPUB_8320 [Trametes pubescens]